MARGPDPDLIGARRRILDREHRLETAETLAAAYRVHRRGVGDAQETILRRLVDMWDRLPPPRGPPPGPPPPAPARVPGRGVGDAQETILRRLVDMWDRLDRLGDPTLGRSYESRPGTTTGDRDEGAATRRYRAMKADLNRQIHRALEDCADRIEGTWEPAPRCPRCSRSQRRPARGCH